MPEGALSKMRAMECDWGNGVVTGSGPDLSSV